MSISSLIGTLSYGAYDLDNTGVKKKNTAWGAQYSNALLTDTNSSSSAKSAGSAAITGKTISNSTTANTLWQAQSIAQSPESSAIDAEVDDTPKKVSKSAEDMFHDFMNKSPEELMRDAVLRECGYTEESLAAMSPEDRAKAEAEIKQRIEEKIKESMREKGVDIGNNAQTTDLAATL